MASTTPSRSVADALAGRRSPQTFDRPGTITLGQRTLRLDEIGQFEATSSEQRDIISPMVTMCGFGMVAAVVALGVLGPGLRWTLLLAAATFALVAVSALDDLRWGSRVRIFTLDVITRSGERIRFATPDAAELARLVQLLERATAGSAAAH
jgi:Family of unknown function (DUF6232)